MTIPTLHNCAHQGDGWCLQCVQSLATANERLVKALEENVKCPSCEGAGAIRNCECDCDAYSDYCYHRNDCVLCHGTGTYDMDPCPQCDGACKYFDTDEAKALYEAATGSAK